MIFHRTFSASSGGIAAHPILHITASFFHPKTYTVSLKEMSNSELVMVEKHKDSSNCRLNESLPEDIPLTVNYSQKNKD